MGAVKCPKHGMQISGSFCEHAAEAVDQRRPMQVFLQKDQYGWFTVCLACVRQLDVPGVVEDAAIQVCEKCIVEWAEVTGSDYVQRCQNPVPEFPNAAPGRGENT